MVLLGDVEIWRAGHTVRGVRGERSAGACRRPEVDHGMGHVAAIECERSLDRALTRTSHLFADTATLREAMASAADVCGDVAGDYVAVVVGLAVAYAHTHPIHEPVIAQQLVDAAHAEPAMLHDARAQLAELDFLAMRVRQRADQLLVAADDVAERTGSSAATT